MEVQELLGFINTYYGETVYRIFDSRNGEPITDGMLSTKFSMSYDYAHAIVVSFTYLVISDTLSIYIEVESCGNTQDRTSTI